MTYDQWIETFKPVTNPIDSNAAFDGYLFETFGAEGDHVRWASERNVWTLIEGDDGNLYIVDGYHWVDRLGYFLTEGAWERGVEYEIPLDN